MFWQGAMTSVVLQPLLTDMRARPQDFPLFTTINGIVSGKLQPADVTKFIQAAKHIQTSGIPAKPTTRQGPKLAPIDMTLSM